MNHEKTMSVCNNAEAVHSAVSFEEVYAMPYVQESIESVLDQNIRQYPLLKGFKDDIRQEILIHLSNQLDSFDPKKSALNTFCRIVIISGIRNARRKYFTRTNCILAHSSNIYDFENHDDDIDELREEDVRAYTEYVTDDIAVMNRCQDIINTVRSCPPAIRFVAEKILSGQCPYEIEKELGLPHSSFWRRYMIPLKKHFIKNFL